MKMYELKSLKPKMQAIFNQNSKINSVFLYCDGFVPNSYKWKAPGIRAVFYRSGELILEDYDRKRSYGRGKRFLAKSEKRGTIRNVCFESLS